MPDGSLGLCSTENGATVGKLEPDANEATSKANVRAQREREEELWRSSLCLCAFPVVPRWLRTPRGGVPGLEGRAICSSLQAAWLPAHHHHHHHHHLWGTDVFHTWPCASGLLHAQGES